MAGKDNVERRCALTNEVKPAADLVRFVVGPDGVLVPDTDAKAEGRGVWISIGETFVAEAVKRKAFARSLKENVTVPDDLPGLTRRRLEQRFVASLQMARKAGQLLTGALKVKSATALENGAPDGLVLAETVGKTVRDVLSYEGSCATATIPVIGMVPMVEGTPAFLADTGVGEQSLIRNPNGYDGNNLATDWVLTTKLTPGAANLP